jgi:predicted nucleic acid-binding protein
LILVDTSVRIDHLRSGNATLVSLLVGGSVLAHPWVVGELALGNIRNRGEVLTLLHGLPQAVVATNDEVLRLVDDEVLYGTGLGYMDVQLLAATRLTSAARLWTAEWHLSALAERLGVRYEPAEDT